MKLKQMKKEKSPPGKIKLAVVGSRSITEFVILDRFGLGALRTLGFSLDDIWQIVSGGAKGADLLSVDLSVKYRIPHMAYLAQWKRRDGSKNMQAGFERNTTIVNECDAAIVLWDGFSHGTMDTVRKLNDAKKPYILIEVEILFENNKKGKETKKIIIGATHFAFLKEWDKLYAKIKAEQKRAESRSKSSKQRRASR